MDIAELTGAYQAAAQAIGLKVVLKSVSAQDYVEFFVDPKFRAGVDGFAGVTYGDYAAPEAMLAQAVLAESAERCAGSFSSAGWRCCWPACW